MMGATIIHLDGPGESWRVVCAVHDLDRTVGSEAHASNLMALHDRIDHPEIAAETTPMQVDVAAAASWVVLVHSDPVLYPQRHAVLAMWALLVGISDTTEAYGVAEQVGAGGLPLVAYTPPF